MAQQDYILRIIEQMGSALARLRKMILGGEIDPDAAEKEMAGVAATAGLDLVLLKSTDLDTLVMLMSPGGEPEPGRCWLTAELFLSEGLRCEAVGAAGEAWDCYERSLRLYGILDPGIIARGFPEVRDRIREVQERMTSLAEASDEP